MFSSLAALVGWIVLVLALLGALGLVRFEMHTSLPTWVAPRTHVCTDGAGISARAYQCTHAEWLAQQQQRAAAAPR